MTVLSRPHPRLQEGVLIRSPIDRTGTATQSKRKENLRFQTQSFAAVVCAFASLRLSRRLRQPLLESGKAIAHGDRHGDEPMFFAIGALR